ncbi:sulfhydryl oxidase 2-like isoform X2 [Andrographis paniculata]|uniref:sulfhydryl oxidase 2-like isoform X2 n=1 Tax=Andrographis paniculata TaxID=175694 RepID=UPI0021E72926|nr:sulfhydryl oxidase 2-like isoform X2 [Andrographis paniculata]
MSSVVSIIVTILVVCAPIAGGSSSVISSPISFGSRSILRSIEKGKAEKPDYAVELNATSFDSVLKETPATYAIVEFFAHWCPACRNYKPQYEKVAKLFNGADAVHPGIILMTRVDCALKINTDLCDKFSVGQYPMLLWGPPSKFLSGSWNPKDKSEIRSIDKGRTAELLLNWINKQLNGSYSLDDKRFENEQNLHANVSDPGQIARAVYDVEEATSTAFNIILDHKMIKPDTWAPLVKFLQLLVVHHPSRRCRKGTAEILVDFDDFSADNKKSPNVGERQPLRNYKICGNDVPRGYWMFCRGSRNETRGFSCGLWVLLHSLSVRVSDGETEMAFTTICDFIHNFFICEECRQHFNEMCSSVSNPFKKSRDLILWLWKAHNKVNERLMKEEASADTGDPMFPKMIWPARQLCPSCYRSKSSKDDDKNEIDWDEDEVYKFLIGYYRETLATFVKVNKQLNNNNPDSAFADDLAVSAHAVVVPIGAALAIAVVSCLFGALACYWRQRQKSRKPRRSWN